MAQLCTLHLSLRWWVVPYLWLVAVVWHTVSPFASSAQRDAYVAWHSAFVVEHGLKVTERSA